VLHKVARLFIDPGSKSLGWAMFEGDFLISHGTVAVKGLWHQRLQDLQYELSYGRVSSCRVEEVHIENVPRVRTCSIYVHYAIGVVASAANAETVLVDIPVKSWQKHVGWKKNKKTKKISVSKEHKHLWNSVDSEDELAAICMGLWFNSQERGVVENSKP
jgi:Holliday junction resolvasome RuvABC endonuclease subunit